MTINKERFIHYIHNNENVMNHYIKCIHKSGLLLNEHDELLTQFWMPYDNSSKTTNLYLYSTSIVTGFIVSCCKRSFWYMAISSIPTAIKLTLEIYKRNKWKRYKNEFTLLIDQLQGIYNTNKKLMHNYQMHKATINNLGCTKELIENFISKRMLDYLLKARENILDLIIFLRDMLKEISDIIDIGELNFIFNMNVSVENFKINYDNEEIVNNFETIQMAYIYIVSTLLCGIGLSLCINEWKSTNRNYIKLFTIIIPKCLIKSKSIHILIKQDFNMIYNKLPSFSEEEKTVTKIIEKPILNVVNNLKEYLQISFTLSNSIQNELMLNNDEIVRSYLEDLENLFMQCNDILKVLQYQLHKNDSTIAKIQSIKDEDFNSDGGNEIIIKYDDPQENQNDEEFNLYIQGSVVSEDDGTPNLEYEQLLEYVKAQKLMIRELNDELRKRQIIKQTDDIPVPAKRKHVNKYNCANSDLETKPEDDLRTVPEKLPPIPPPVPVDDTSKKPRVLTNVSGIEMNTAKTKSFHVDSLESQNNLLSQIRTAAMNRGVEETIFGDDTSSSSNEN